MAIVYHGSKNVVKNLKNPENSQFGFFRKDFGYGFYCTRKHKQAKKWVKKKYEKKGFINSYYYNERYAIENLKVKIFKEDDEWLNFVALNRSEDVDPEFDIIEGPMADDEIYDYVDDFNDGIMSREEFWEKAKFKEKTNQICFLTKEAIKCLNFKGCEKYEEQHKNNENRIKK